MKKIESDLASKLNLSAMGLSHLENGSRELKISVLELWAKELGLELEIKLTVK